MRRTVSICSASLVWAVLLLFDIVPILRGGYGWRWQHELPSSVGHVIPLALSTAVYIGVSLWMQARQHSAYLLPWTVIGGVVLTLSAVYVREPAVSFELYTRTLSGGATGWHYASTDIDDLDETLSNWPTFMDSYVGQSSHMTTSPPGLPLAFYSTIQFFDAVPVLADTVGPPLREAQCHHDRVVGWSLHPGYTNAELSSTWLGMLMPLFAALTVIPLYALSKRFFSIDTAHWSIIWWPLVPSVLMFTPNPTPLYAAIGLSVVYLLLFALQTSKVIPLLAAGAVMGLGIFLHFTLLPIVFLCGFLTLAYHWQKRDNLDRRWSIRVGVWYGVGLSIVWLIYWVVSGITLIDIMRQTFDEHLALDRPYWPWLFLHLNDIFMFTGWSIVLAAVLTLIAIGRKLLSSEDLCLGEWLLVGAALTLALMDISGTTQGESGRIWLFISPFMLIAAARLVDIKFRHGALLTVTQGILLLVMVTTLPVIDSGLSKPLDQPPHVRPPTTDLIPTNTQFDEGIRLTAFSGETEGNTILLWLDWAASQQIDTPYYVSLLPVFPDGQTPDNAYIVQPFTDTTYPVTCWARTDNTIRTYFEIPTTAPMATGDIWISVALVDRNGQTLSVITPAGLTDSQIGIGPIN